MTEPQQIKRPKAFDPESDLVVIKGGRSRPGRDLYHWLIRKPWWATVLIVSLNFLGANLLFALGYALVGGVHGMRDGSIVDAFFFSVQTMGTLGYGAMYPETLASHSLVVVEVIVGILSTALATGLVFTKFSTPTPRVFFSKNAIVTPYDGVPTLMCRVGNERGDHVIDARLRMTIIRTEKNQEGQTFYRTRDLRLAREHAPTFRRGTTMMHPIDASSPLFGQTPASLEESDAELVVSIIGLDGTTSQTVYAGTSYLADEILFGRRLSDTVRELPDGRVELDLAKFDDTEPSEPTATFPYPEKR
jgi:inward rectifier potassium channel